MHSVRVLLHVCTISHSCFLKLLGIVVCSQATEAMRYTSELQKPTMPCAERVEVWSGVVLRPAGAQAKLLQWRHATDRSGVLPLLPQQSQRQGYTVIWTEVRRDAFLLSLHTYRFIACNSASWFLSAGNEFSVYSPHHTGVCRVCVCANTEIKY